MNAAIFGNLEMKDDPQTACVRFVQYDDLEQTRVLRPFLSLSCRFIFAAEF